MSDSKTSDAISRSAAIDIINEERRFIESLRETAFDNEDRAHNIGELGCAIRLARKIKELPALDVAPVVHDKDIRSSIITVENVDEWQGRIILADDGTQVCAVYYADGDDCVPVVRCKDCKWYDSAFYACSKCGVCVNRDFYCADGEKE